MSNKKINIGEQYRALSVNPASLNEENRSVDVVFATETPVLKCDWSISSRNDGLFYEVLSCMPEHVRMDRMKAGASVLDSHEKYSIKSQFGVVDSAKVEGNQGVATIRFSKRADVEPIWQDVKDKIYQNISCGYRVYRFEAMPGMGEDQIPSFRAIDWEPTEISLTPVQADFNSKVRAGQTSDNQVEIIINSREMEENTTPPVTPEPGAGTRSDAPPATPPATPPANNDAVIQAERTRVSEILDSVRSAGLEVSFGEKLIKDGVSIDQARKLVIDEFAKKDPHKGANNNVRTGADEADKVRAIVSDALVLRADPVQEKKMKAENVTAAREFRRSLVDLSRMMLERSNVNTSLLTPREIAERALAVSDLPNILASTVNRTLLNAYEEAPRTFAPFCRRTSGKDFRDMYRTQLSSLPTLSLIREGGEYPYGKMSDQKETYKLAKYGEIIAINWESIINDDLDAFSRLPIMIANAAANKQSDIVYGILIDNGNMADGVALFEASSHGNYASTGTTIPNGIAAAKAAMRKQKGLGAAGTKASGFYLNIEPKFLIVGPDKEVEAWQLLNGIIVPNTVASANMFTGSMQGIVEPRITGNAWYLAAEPGRVDTIEYAFLEGENELFTERRMGWEVDGLEIKVRMVFAAKAIDHRGLYKNVGA